MALALPEGWRGLAHFQVESRRSVLKKSPRERSFNELYIVEEIFSSVKLISNLPFSKRLEVCKLLRYQQVQPNTIVYKNGDLATALYIIFTGSVKVVTIGKRSREIFTILKSGDYFGESCLLNKDSLRSETITTQEKSELLTLSKEDYDSVLKIEISSEIKERVELLKSVRVLRGIPEQSLQRLASLLTLRTFSKNRVITFQGEEAVEMYFMKSGECRVVMEVPREPKPSPHPLPQAALRPYRSTKHERCKKKFQENNQQPPSSCISLPARSQSVPPTLASKILTVSSKSKPVGIMATPASQRSTYKSTNSSWSTCGQQPKRSTLLLSSSYFVSKDLTVRGSCSQIERFSPSCSESNSVSEQGFDTSLGMQQERRRHSQLSRLSFVSIATAGDSDVRDSSTGQIHPKLSNYPAFSQRQKTEEHSNPQSIIQTKIISPQFKHYTLKSFLQEFQNRESGSLIEDLNFSDRECHFWQTGTNRTGMLRGDVSDATDYQNKFENWAGSVIARHIKVKAKEVVAQGLVSDILKDSVSNTWKTIANKASVAEGTMLLDVGALHVGDFFGEIGLLHDSQRKASILTVTRVEVLVLNKWDFHRQLDRDIIDCLSANSYKKIEYIFQEYQKTCRWALYKKKVLQEVLASRRQRFPNLYGHDMCRGKPCAKA